MSDPSDDYYHHPHGRGYAPPGGGGYYQPQGPGYAQSHVGYGPPNHYPGGRGQQVVHYNPFAPMGNGGGSNFFGDPRGSGYDSMVPYQQGYYGGYGAPPGMQQYMFAPPPPPPTEVPAPPHTPAPPPDKKPDPEMEKIKAQLELLQAEKSKKDEAEKQAAIETKIRKDAEEAFQRRMDEMKKAQEEAKKEIEKAKADAERAARDRIEAERKAEEDRRKAHDLQMKRLEQEARDKLDAERRADEEKKKRDAEVAAIAEAALKAKIEAAEAAAKAKVEKAIKEEAEARALAKKKEEEEAAWRKKLEEEAKLKAELDARNKIEAEKKKAEEEAAAAEEKKKFEKALKDKLQEEADAKALEALKKKEKAPIKFKDAVGRKFSFPFHLCQTWPVGPTRAWPEPFLGEENMLTTRAQGMEELIKQAFLHVDVIGPHVHEGHYDLLGPNGEIILPSVWEKVVEPDWAITMHMWPMDKNPLRHHPPGPGGMPMGARDPRMAGRMGPPPPNNMRPQGRPFPGAPPPPGWGVPGRGMPPMRPPPTNRPNVVSVSPPDANKKKSSKPAGGFMSNFMTGKSSKSGKK